VKKWNEVREEIFTPEEIKASDLRVSITSELIKARQERGISQRKLEQLSGVRQPIISRMEKGTVSPHLDTILKVLEPLGKTLVVAPIENSEHTTRQGKGIK
jgi:transcriptional regulator with XRE-family HTH domain